jgi:hypothetical protein
MKLVGYNLCSLAFHLSHIALTVQGQLSVTQLALPLAYFLISPEFFTVPSFLSSIYRTLYNYHTLSDTSSHIHLHTIHTARIVLCRMFYVDWRWFWKSKL